MICKRCGKDVSRGWRYCPNCGSVVEAPSRSLFDDIFSRIREFRKEMNQAGKLMDKDIEVMDIPESMWNQPKGHCPRNRSKGFTIRITRRNNQNPKVDVKTWGNVDKSEIHRHVKHQMEDLGVRGIKLRYPGDTGVPDIAREVPKKREIKQNQPQSPARTTEEPETVVKRVGQKIIADISLPDVKTKDTIEIVQLQSSVEVRARAGDKAYFKIITKPETLKVSEKRFEKGMLHLEFA